MCSWVLRRRFTRLRVLVMSALPHLGGDWSGSRYFLMRTQQVFNAYGVSSSTTGGEKVVTLAYLSHSPFHSLTLPFLIPPPTFMTSIFSVSMCM